MNEQRVMLIPLDPVHDVGLKMIRRGLNEAGHETILLPPDLPVEEAIQEIVKADVNTILVSRTLGYGVAEILARFVDLLDAAGIRERVKVGIGGMAIRPELAAELGFDAGFGPGTTIEEAVAFVEGREVVVADRVVKQKREFTIQNTYEVRHQGIKEKLDKITDQILGWAENKTSPGVRRAEIREELWDVKRWRNYEPMKEFEREYVQYAEDMVRNFYEKGVLHPKTRRFTKEEVIGLQDYVSRTVEL
ncbi:MAG TPA: cobalamin-dependent protein, partial [Bacillota bacterium]|nr:cobalamin-dependent protein [Bacillota bacterium]